jgi:ADP-ribosyl-[dinitrogen reductase] hydrolase
MSPSSKHLKTNEETRDRFRGCLVGLACGDAVGTTVEFRPRGTFSPVTDMVGGGPFRLNPGEWTDDTSMALCLASSLVERGTFDALDQMERYLRWFDEGYLSSNGRCFDIGTTLRRALGRFRHSREPFSGSTDPYSAGNGCIMRLAPVPMFFFCDRVAAIQMSGEASRTTHGTAECVDSSRLFGGILWEALSGSSKADVLLRHGVYPILSGKVDAIAHGDYRLKKDTEIRGTGYVVECLEAALWCFEKTSSFEDAVLGAVNLGDDADTTGAVCGQIAGAFYGASAIPPRWRSRLIMHDEIVNLSDRLYEAGMLSHLQAES